jgi:drug/metabolite transporter (DMT)-like permease
MALGAALLLILIWGANFSVQKYLLNTLTPSGFLLARYLIMPLCALILMRVTLGKFLPPLPREDVLSLALWGTVCMWALFAMASICRRLFRAR